ncbi:MAG: hypothetical protein N2234_05260 [Planctomycetota bacterium]|nr:hypothetical protein [Planctomycetota bacterium]
MKERLNEAKSRIKTLVKRAQRRLFLHFFIHYMLLLYALEAPLLLFSALFLLPNQRTLLFFFFILILSLFNIILSALLAKRKTTPLLSALALDKTSDLKERITTSLFLLEKPSLSEAETFVLLDSLRVASSLNLRNLSAPPLPRWTFALLWLYLGCPLSLIFAYETNGLQPEERILIKVSERIQGAFRDTSQYVRETAEKLRKTAKESDSSQAKQLLLQLMETISAVKKESKMVEESFESSSSLKELMKALGGGSESLRSLGSDGAGLSQTAGELEKLSSAIQHQTELKLLLNKAAAALLRQDYRELKETLEGIRERLNLTKESATEAENAIRAAGGLPLPGKPSTTVTTEPYVSAEEGEISPSQKEIFAPSDLEYYPEELKRVIRAYFLRK